MDRVATKSQGDCKKPGWLFESGVAIWSQGGYLQVSRHVA